MSSKYIDITSDYDKYDLNFYRIYFLLTSMVAMASKK